jgi:phenylalanyl-tRNA synthetase beta chain
MLISVKWLRELVELPAEVTPRELGDKLTLAGLEVEAIEDLAEGYEGIVVGEVLSVEKHPDADKLKVCQVNGGDGPETVVCGAPNVEAGMKVPFALVGAELPNGMKIKQAKIRGVESSGMLCSEKELELSEDHSGLMVLEAGEPGQPIAELIGRDDVVLEIGVTPNRPDALSHLGVAREVAALFEDARVKAAVPTCPERGGPVDDRATVKIEDPDGCPRYGCRIIDNVKIGQSPMWVRARLAAVGVRAINNVVDVTNLVMMERGIPLHAFDYERLSADRDRAGIIVRRAQKGERLVTLDDVDRSLLEGDLVIADLEKPIALAGVMGGANSEVHGETTSILLEGAHFDPSSVRRTARRLGIHSEASHRFERGCDPNGVRQSLDRAAALIAELSGGQIARGLVDAYPKKVEPLVVTLRLPKVADLLGHELDERTITSLLLSVGLEVDGREGDGVRFRVPTYRPDLEREVDLIEEIARLIGYDAIEATLPARTGVGRGLVDNGRLRVEDAARSALEGGGFHEAVNFAFISPEHATVFSAEAQHVRIQNPLGEEMSVMRPSLLPGLIESAQRNLRRGELGVRLYEVATIFNGHNPEGVTPRLDDADGPPGGDAWVHEQARVGIVIAGQRPGGFDQDARPYDIYDALGAVEAVAARIGLQLGYADAGAKIAPVEAPAGLHPRSSAALLVDGVACAIIGELHPKQREAFDVKAPLFLAELDTVALAARAPGLPRAGRPPKFPSVRRDLALLVDDGVEAGDIARALAEQKKVRGYIETVDVFDIYKGDHVPDGKKSLALSFTLRAADRTLTDDEVNELATALVDEAREKFSAEVRS